MPSVYYTPKRSPNKTPKRTPKKLPTNNTLVRFFGPIIGAKVKGAVKHHKRY